VSSALRVYPRRVARARIASREASGYVITYQSAVECNEVWQKGAVPRAAA